AWWSGPTRTRLPSNLVAYSQSFAASGGPCSRSTSWSRPLRSPSAIAQSYPRTRIWLRFLGYRSRTGPKAESTDGDRRIGRTREGDTLIAASKLRGSGNFRITSPLGSGWRTGHSYCCKQLSYGGRENRRSLIRQKMVQFCRRTGERRLWPPTGRTTFRPSRASSTSSSNRADPFPRSSRLSPAGNTRTPPRKRGRRPGPRSVGVLRISTPGAFDHSRNSTANFGRSTGWPPEDDLPRSTDCPGRGGRRLHIQLDLRAKSRRGQALVRSVVVSGLAVFRPSGKVLRI